VTAATAEPLAGPSAAAGLRVADLAISRDREPMIGPVWFEVPAGSAVSIVGETGAGKTLLLRSLMGLLPAGFGMSGEVTVADGQPLRTPAQLRAELGRHVGVVLQNPFTAFDPLRPVGKQVTEGVLRRKLMTRQAAGERAVGLLRQAGFERPDELQRLFPGQLSGGMAQRVAIAAAVMPDPGVVLADEPTSALDAVLRVRVLGLLREFARRRGAALVMISHDLSLAAEFSQQLIVLYSGRVVESGPAAELTATPRHPYTRALIACTPRLGSDGKRELPSIPGSVPSPLQQIKGCRFAARCPLVIDRCRTEEPELRTLGGARVACHVAKEGGTGTP
jgi:oligopeptide/dipeptide ABC transporter ATP-binding protein